MDEKKWREAATLIVVARDHSKTSEFDYKVLMFHRTEKTSLLPYHSCFAGGVVDKSDESQEWINVTIFLQRLCKELELSLRITAIREMFEELGVVFCHDQSTASTSPFSHFFHTKDCDIPVWQNKVHNHEESLLAFCERFKVVPDIMNIYAWSCWLTPTFTHTKRYETAFFLAALEHVPPIYPESYEVQEFFWESPDKILQQFEEKKLWLPPPIFAEVIVLSNFKSIDKLVEFAKERNRQEAKLIMPIQLATNDGFLQVLPGDDLYPENPNYFETDHDVQQFSDKSMKELRVAAKNLYRIEQRNLYDFKLLNKSSNMKGKITLKENIKAKL